MRPERSYNHPGPDLSSFVTIHLTSRIQKYINTCATAWNEGNGGGQMEGPLG